MLAVEEALKLVEKHAKPLAPWRVPLGDAAGLVLAEDIISEVNSPPYDKSLMDGYAVRSSDTQPERQILEEIAAGDVPRLPITPGTASRIMTGAPLPEGADAVVPFEQTDLLNPTAIRLLDAGPSTGKHVLRLGAALRAGDVVLRKGALLRPIEIAILAEIGRGVVHVVPQPRMAILPTGNELVPLGEKPARGQIRNSNGPMLLAAAQRLGARAIELGIARDESEELRRWIEQGLAADVLVLCGGVSVGKFDLVPQVLRELAVEQVFHKVALRPGKPLWFGLKRDGERKVFVFGLPGNPMSSFVCFELFVRPALVALAGRGFIGAARAAGRLTHAYDHRGGRAAYLPARITGDPAGPRSLEILPWQGSADLATVARANALAHLPVEKRRFAPGDELEIMLI
jgi:molybdopterin molybdotransferase